MSLETLPDDLLAEVFFRLDPFTLHSYSSVCKRWASMISDDTGYWSQFTRWRWNQDVSKRPEGFVRSWKGYALFRMSYDKVKSCLQHRILASKHNVDIDMDILSSMSCQALFVELGHCGSTSTAVFKDREDQTIALKFITACWARKLIRLPTKLATTRFLAPLFDLTVLYDFFDKHGNFLINLLLEWPIEIHNHPEYSVYIIHLCEEIAAFFCNMADHNVIIECLLEGLEEKIDLILQNPTQQADVVEQESRMLLLKSIVHFSLKSSFINYNHIYHGLVKLKPVMIKGIRTVNHNIFETAANFHLLLLDTFFSSHRDDEAAQMVNSLLGTVEYLNSLQLPRDEREILADILSGSLGSLMNSHLWATYCYPLFFEPLLRATLAELQNGEPSYELVDKLTTMIADIAHDDDCGPTLLKSSYWMKSFLPTLGSYCAKIAPLSMEQMRRLQDDLLCFLGEMLRLTNYHLNMIDESVKQTYLDTLCPSLFATLQSASADQNISSLLSCLSEIVGLRIISLKECVIGDKPLCQWVQDNIWSWLTHPYPAVRMVASSFLGEIVNVDVSCLSEEFINKYLDYSLSIVKVVAEMLRNNVSDDQIMDTYNDEGFFSNRVWSSANILLAQPGKCNEIVRKYCQDLLVLLLTPLPSTQPNTYANVALLLCALCIGAPNEVADVFPAFNVNFWQMSIACLQDKDESQIFAAALYAAAKASRLGPDEFMKYACAAINRCDLPRAFIQNLSQIGKLHGIDPTRSSSWVGL